MDDGSQRGTVLIVEDNADNRAIFTTILEFHGFRVLAVNDGAEGVRLARARHPDVILMDIGLPVLDGLAATRMLKADAATSAIPIIAVTAHVSPQDREQCLSAGCDDYLPKPSPPDEIFRTVRRAAARAGRGNGLEARQAVRPAAR